MTKTADAFRTISEAAQELDLPQHVLRFWETRFHQIKPLKRGGGRRYYRPDDLTLLAGIKHLLYSEGYTIKAVQRLFKEHGNGFVHAVGRGGNPAELVAERQAAAGETVSSGGEPPAPGEVVLPDGIRADAATDSTDTKGLMGRAKALVSGSSNDALPLHGLTAEERKSLQDTLFELLECKRILDQAR
ncbi:MAG: MerR family transcriptional regulator [Pseudomonadota bacterium]